MCWTISRDNVLLDGGGAFVHVNSRVNPAAAPAFYTLALPCIPHPAFYTCPNPVSKVCSITSTIGVAYRCRLTMHRHIGLLAANDASASLPVSVPQSIKMKCNGCS